MTIGRGAGNDATLVHPQVSRTHARIVGRDGELVIEDMGSTTGTFVNGQRVEQQPLREGDVIRIGPHRMVFKAGRLQVVDEEGNLRLDALHLQKVVAKGTSILQDVSLSIHPQEFVAIVGASGSGKSTLLNALCGFRPATAGAVLLNGVDLYDHFDAYRNELGYVPQDDIIHRELSRLQGAGLRCPTENAVGHHQRGAPRAHPRGDGGAGLEQPRRPAHPAAQRRATQAGVHRCRAADPPQSLLPGRGHVGAGPGHRGPDDEAPAPPGRPGAHGAAGHPRHQERDDLRQGGHPGQGRLSGLLRAAGGGAPVLRCQRVRRDLRATGDGARSRGMGGALPRLAAVPGARQGPPGREGQRPFGRRRRGARSRRRARASVGSQRCASSGSSPGAIWSSSGATRRRPPCSCSSRLSWG